MFDSSSNILITGGTGSFGKAFLSTVLDRYPSVGRIVILSRDELKQWNIQQEFPVSKYPQLRFFLGDVRDRSRLYRALNGVDTVVHAAALKQVPAAEYNPTEFIRTNISGAENLIEACIDQNVKRVIALSTDKASAPINLYGATKLCSDKLFVAANNYKGNKNIRFSVVRYGNVMGSRGSVIPFFLKQASSGELHITNREMTRFNITLNEGVDMVLWALSNSIGGEIFIPKIPSYKIVDIAKAIGPSCNQIVTGIRPGEKIHEEMITISDSPFTIDLGQYYAILPCDNRLLNLYKKNQIPIKNVQQGFSYNSGTNPDFLTIEKIRNLIIKNINSSFIPI